MVFPQACLHCDNELEWGDILVCVKCMDKLQPSRLNNWVSDVTTNDAIDFAYSAFWYDKVIHDCIHSAKYNGYRKLLKTISGRAVDLIIDGLMEEDVDLVLPVPLHHVKYRERGYNQAQIVANIVARQLGVPAGKRLKRNRFTPSQTKLDIDSRKENMQMAFRYKGRIPSLTVLIIDDVLTTGATVNECCQTVKSAGASRAGVMTLATPQLRNKNNLSKDLYSN